MKNNGRTWDNNQRGKITDIFNDSLVDEVCSDINSIANTSMKDLVNKHENLLIFPGSLGYYNDGIESLPIFFLNDEILATGNIMGFVGKGNTQLTIHSRFYPRKNDYFLHYMLQRVFSINLFQLEANSTQEQLWDFLIYLFPVLLEKALRQGIFREYQHFEFNDSRLKGAIDISRHLQSNIPFRGNIAYRTREYSYNNRITQLIRHTIEVIQKKQRTRVILTNNRGIKDAVDKIKHVTPDYRREQRQQVIAKNLRRISHPYYVDYLPLQKLCIQILRHEKLTYGNDEDKIYGILFDGAWLWEEYLNTILEQCDFIHPENKTGNKRIALFEDGSGHRFPDFYKGDIVIDAKYKRLGNDGYDRNDIHQLISYMHVLTAKIGIFMYPAEKPERPTPSTLKGCGGNVVKYGFNIAQNMNSFEEFSDAMESEERKTMKIIQEIQMPSHKYRNEQKVI